jgi:putative membrane protein
MPSYQSRNPSRQLKDYLWLAACGFFMGSANVVPGVSGATIAFILGFYEELIDAINAANPAFFRRLFTFRLRQAFSEFPWRFLLALGLGIVLAIFTLAEGLTWAFHHHPELVWAFFFGLVLASAVVIRKRVARWSSVTLLISGLAAVVTFVLIGLRPLQTPDTAWFLMLSGAIAICVMILPGVSGAFVLVLLGKYQYMLEAVVRFDVLTLLIFATGAAGGLMIFTRTIRWLFFHHRDKTIAALVGLMLGSLRKIWPWKEQGLPTAFTLDVGLVLVLAAFGIGLVLILQYLAGRRVFEVDRLKTEGF